MSGEIIAVIASGVGQTIVILGYLEFRLDRIEERLGKRIDRVEESVQSLERSVHADFIDHLRREHKLGDS